MSPLGRSPYVGPTGGPCQYFVPTCPPASGVNGQPAPTPTYNAQGTSCSYTPTDGKTCATGYTLSNGICTATIGQNQGGDNFGNDLKNTFQGIGQLFNDIFQIIGALIKYNLVGWITCFLTAGTVPCPTTAGTPWSFDCPVNGTIDTK